MQKQIGAKNTSQCS